MMSTVTVIEVIEPFPYDEIGPLGTQASTTAATVDDATTQSPDDAGN